MAMRITLKTAGILPAFRTAGILPALLFVLFSSTIVSAEDWPQWRGPNRDGISKETGILKTWPPAGPKVLWKAPLGLGYSSITVSQGRVYTLASIRDSEYAI